MEAGLKQIIKSLVIKLAVRKIKRKEIGDIDFIFRLTKDTYSRDLFPSLSFCNNIMIKANTLILIELTSMAGEAAMIQIDSLKNKYDKSSAQVKLV